eukprot:TRINITY_DN6729_c0_g1_i2.p1 TRINITY_DN6729_c0_g1~~TRINITY_DN6729_c0_g1_i2.p1  ORF type:complete len:217 (+),score=21.99 TRINITY_DN6729_c0_g1_i2:91-741(+)
MAGFDPENLHVIETLVTSRAKTIDYIRRVHGGGVRYLDIVEISSAEIATAYATDKRQPIVKRVEQWFNLGMSLAPLLRLNSSEVYVRAVAQLVEEYDYFYANAASKGLRLLKGVGGPSKEQAEAEGLIRPTVGGAYEQLQITRLPFALGYTPTVLSLLEILGHVYKKFIDPVCSKPHLFDGIQRIDKKLQVRKKLHLGTQTTFFFVILTIYLLLFF